MDELSPTLGGLPALDADVADQVARSQTLHPSAHEVLALRSYLGQAMHHAPFLVWPFQEAPPALQALSTHGGDEDWVVYVPPGQVASVEDWAPRWIEATGACDVSQHEIQVGHNKAMVYIGAHA